MPTAFPAFVDRIRDQNDFAGTPGAGTAGYFIRYNHTTGLFDLAAVPPPPVTSVNGQIGAVSLTTTNIPEGANLYFTVGRAAAVAPVQSVFGRIGSVVAGSGDYSVAQVTGAAPLASPALTGTPTAPTAAASTNTTQIATTAFVMGQGFVTSATSPVTSVFGRVGAVVAASGDYAVGQVTGAAPLASPSFTGGITAVGAASGVTATFRSNATTPGDLTQWKDGSGTVLTVIDASGNVVFGGDATLTRIAANTLAQKNSTNRQLLRVYRDATAFHEIGSNWAGIGYASIKGPTDQPMVLECPSYGLTITNSAGSGVSAVFDTTSNRFTALSASAIPIVARGAASQSANLQEWQNSSTTPLAYVDRYGAGVFKGDTTGSAPSLEMAVSTTYDSNFGPVGFIRATNTLIGFFSGSSTRVLTFGAIGTPGTNVIRNGGLMLTCDAGGASQHYATFSTTAESGYSSHWIRFQAANASTPGLLVTGAASQSANLQEWQSNASVVHGSISENGYFTTRKNTAPADAELVAGEAAWWFDSTDGAGKLMVKAKTANGTVVTGSVVLA